jgi:hypothetical protein
MHVLTPFPSPVMLRQVPVLNGAFSVNLIPNAGADPARGYIPSRNIS